MYSHNYAASDSPRYPSDAQGGQWSQADNGDDYDGDGDDGADDVGPGGDGDGAEGRDAKRRRIARACDMCRKKKIKCDGKMPKCSHCENYKTECIFTPVEKKRAPPKGAKYIEGLENRLVRMESLLRLGGLLAEDDGGRTDLGTLEKRLAERQQSQQPTRGTTNGSSGTPPSRDTPAAVRRDGVPSTGQTPATNTPKDQAMSPPTGTNKPPETNNQRPVQNSLTKGVREVDVLADQMCSLITNNCGETRYIGSSSGFSIFSPKGIKWVNEKTGDSSFQSMISTATNEDKTGWDHWRPEVFDDIFARRIFKPLPNRQECYALLRDYFENFNCMFPLFHEPTFMHLVDKHYSLDPYEGSGWWASLNVALAIAHRLRVMSNVVSQEEDNHAWGYLKNAMAVMTELTMRNTDLLSVQALLGMALFLQGTSNPQPSFFLVAAAIRLAHSIGLHKRGSGFNLNDVENEQRKRVFWIAYCLDKDICLRSGRPPAQDDDDMNVELPSEDPPDNIGNIPLAKESAEGKRTMNLFRLMCAFAGIQSRVYKQLYSVKASRQSDGELLNTIGELDLQLEEWKDSIPLDFRPEHEIKAAHTPLILHVVVLHFAYYNCLTTIHRMSVHHGYWTSRLSDYAIQGLNARPLNPRVFMSAALCVNAARTSIGLIRYIPQGDYACVWLILYYPVSALVTLFANILQNPQDVRARGDLRLMSSVCSFLTMLERDAAEANGNVRRMLSVCSEFERIAKVVLDKAEREMRGTRGKRRHPDSAAAATAANPTNTTSGSVGEKEKPHTMERDQRLLNRHRPGGDEANAAFAQSLDDGKTLEQMQVETQAAYRRPVQTPSLRAASQAGSGIGSSPVSWGQSPPGNLAPDFQKIAGLEDLWNGGGAPPSSAGFVPNMQNGGGDQYSQTRPPDFDPASFQPPSSTMTMDPLNAGGGSTGGPFGTPTNTNFGGPFQQPFVPQDLWQMPMTLEWDWAEGLGLGTFGTSAHTMFDAGAYGTPGDAGVFNPVGGQDEGGGR